MIGKGYYRRAMARLLLGRFDEAEEDVAAAEAAEAEMVVDAELGLRRMCDSLRARIRTARVSARSHWEGRLRRQWERQLRRRAGVEQDESEYQSDEEGSDEVEIAHLFVGGEDDAGEESQSDEYEDEDDEEDEDEVEEEEEEDEDEDEEDEEVEEDEEGKEEEGEEEAYDSALSPSAHNDAEPEDAPIKDATANSIA